MTTLSKTSWELLESITAPYLVDNSITIQSMETGELFKALHLALSAENERKVLEASVELLEKDGGGGSTSSSSGQYHRAVIQEFKHATSKRTVWKVGASSSRGSSYLCFRHYCSCPSYAQVAQKSQATTDASTSSGVGAISGGVDTHVMCKHLLAIRIAKCLNMVESHSVDTATFMTCCCNF
jgi:predicted nucleic acid-binding Zn finger protein